MFLLGVAHEHYPSTKLHASLIHVLTEKNNFFHKLVKTLRFGEKKFRGRVFFCRGSLKFYKVDTESARKFEFFFLYYL